MSEKKVTSSIGRLEFIVLMAAMTALDAFSIDGMLPALDNIASDLNVVVENHRQYVVTSLFFGFSVGVLIYGFLSDQYGRRMPVVAGFVVFFFGSLLCIFANTFTMLLAGRVLQGLGAAGPYVLATAIVRDLYKGRDMAQVMSLISAVFIGVPMVAPFLGQGVMMLAGWRSFFIVLAIYACLVLAWFWFRQKETLLPEHRQALSVLVIKKSVVEALTHTQFLRYLFAMSVAMGAFIAYLSTAQQTFQVIYNFGNWFPLVFASIASVFGIGSVLNARWVHSVGSARLVHRALSVIVLVSGAYALANLFVGGLPPVWVHLAYLCVFVFCFAFLFGNITSLALEQMGHIAGSASSLFNSISTIIAIGIAITIGALLDDHVQPIIVGFGIFCAIALVLNYPRARIRLDRDHL